MWRAGMLIALWSRFRTRLHVVWILVESDGDGGEDCSDRDHTGGMEIVGELLREAAPTCLRALRRLCTHGRSMHLNWTQATSYFVQNWMLVKYFAKLPHSGTSQVRFYPVTEIWRTSDAGGGGAWQYPSMRACPQSTAVLVIEKRVKSVLLLSLSFDFLCTIIAAFMSLFYWFWCVVKSTHWLSSHKPFPALFFSQRCV